MQSFRQQRQISTRWSKWADEQSITTQLEGSTERERDNVGIAIPNATSWEATDQDMDPKNWPLARKFNATLLVTLISFAVQYASAVDSAAAQKIEADFGVSAVTESLATGLFLLGFAIGAPIAGPLSEIAGRNPVYIASFLVFMCFTVGAALSPNIGAQLAFRFLAGLFGSTPMVCAGGTLSDLWTPLEQVYIFPMYATGGFLGVAVGPAVGGVITESDIVGWRWVEWSTLVLSALVLLLVLILQPETYDPILLRWKADAVAELTRAKTEDIAPELSRVTTTRQLGAKVAAAFYRPVELAVYEPIIVMISLYLSVLYIVLFTFLPGYIYIFTDVYGFGPALRGLSFMGLGVGFVLALAVVPPVTAMARRAMSREGGELQPELTLHYAMCGAPTIPVALFWMGWTARPSISPWSALAASALLGFGILCVFISSYQYIIRTYEQFAASGLVFVTLSRYLLAGGMVVVGIPMYENLGVAHTLTVLGSLAAVLVPVPFCLFWFGPTIRRWSRHSM